MSAVLETLRFTPPAQNVARLAGDDMVCQDVQLRAGQVASASIVAACRDPRRYAGPHEFDVARVAGKQLYFGAGAHYCLGASLAKLGLGIAFETLARRCPDLALADGGLIEWDYEGFAGVVHLDCTAVSAPHPTRSASCQFWRLQQDRPSDGEWSLVASLRQATALSATQFLAATRSGAVDPSSDRTTYRASNMWKKIPQWSRRMFLDCSRELSQFVSAPDAVRRGDRGRRRLRVAVRGEPSSGWRGGTGPG